MTPKPPKPKPWPSLTVLGLIPLIACSSPPGTYCPTPLHPDGETRAWLHALTPPPSAVRYFNQVANREAVFDRGCK